MKSYLLRTNDGMDKLKSLVIATFVILAAVVYSSAAFAWDANQLYFKGSVGQANYDGSASGQVGSIRYEIDDKSISFDVGAGYSFNDNVAIEGSFFYVSEGDWSISGRRFHDTGTFESYGIAAATVLRLPVNNSFGLLGKLGVYRAELDVTDDATGFSSEADESDILAGVGADFRLNDSVALVVGYDYYNDSGQNVYVGVRFSP